MIYSFSDFLADYSVIIILAILGAILGIIYYLKRKVLSKYDPIDDEEDQTPEEILQDELDSILVTEKYNPNAEKNKKDKFEEDDDDFDYDNNFKKEEQNNDFDSNVDVSYSFQNFEDNNEK